MNEAMAEQIHSIKAFMKLSNNTDASINSGKAVLRFDIRIMRQLLKSIGIMIQRSSAESRSDILKQFIILDAMIIISQEFSMPMAPSFHKDMLDIIYFIT